MKYIWKDYVPKEMDWVEDWLDQTAVENTGLEEGWKAFYEYWKESQDCTLGQNYWCKAVSDREGFFGIAAFGLWEGSVTVMEVLIAPQMRGQGKGTSLLRELLQEGQTIFGHAVKRAEAVIFSGNEVSQRAFQNAGFYFDHVNEDGDVLYYVFSGEEGDIGTEGDLPVPVKDKQRYIIGRKEDHMNTENSTLRNEENPVIDGLFADPDLCMAEGTYYIYPTTDGFDGWSGHEFYVFTSRDGKHFQKGPRILDVASEQVPWATGYAWAPCMTEKNGKYYFYFCAKDASGVSCIGAASGDTPEGPFTAQAQPMITMDMMREQGIAMGQTIDPSVYREGEDAWLVFGNGGAAVARLSEDMLHIEPDTLRNIQGLKDFCESLIVFKRQGRYHFSWSCNDTRSEDYHVNYGVSDSLYGPVTFIRTILEKDREKEILGTGHHSILKIPGEERYLMAYHRFARPLARYPKGAARGWHRETCMAELAFDQDGCLLPVIKNG